MAMFHLLRIRTSIDTFVTEKCKCYFCPYVYLSEYVLQEKNGINVQNHIMYCIQILKTLNSLSTQQTLNN